MEQRFSRSQAKNSPKWTRQMLGYGCLWVLGEEKLRYIKFDKQDTKQYFQNPPPDLDIFVPVRTALDLGTPIFDNADDNDNHGIDEEGNELVSEWKDDTLVEQCSASWNFSADSLNKRIDVRADRLLNDYGKWETVAITHELERVNNWTTYVRKSLGLTSSKSFRPSRQCKFPLTQPLLIQPLLKRKRLIESRSTLSFGQFFHNLIKSANATNDQNKQDDGDGVWKVELLDPSQGEPPDYIVISKDPFEFYITLIHRKDWNSYMSSLSETGAHPVRRFISLHDHGDACKTLDKIQTATGTRDLRLQGDLKAEQRQALGLKSEDSAYDSEEGRAIRPQDLAVKFVDKRLQGIEAFQKGYDFTDGETVIDVDLAASKIYAASGKRPKEYTQAAVMGNYSASDIATSLGWEKPRLSSGFFSSEWLHLAAFSWGGYLPSGTNAGFSTSQNPENLVFGTSETNSYMTRYEKAWQDFYKKEQQLHDYVTSQRNQSRSDLKGALQIICNDFEKPIRHDILANGQFDITSFQLDPAVVKEVSERAARGGKLYDHDEDDSSPRYYDDGHPKSFTTDWQMVALAHLFPFVVYSMQYIIECNFPSKLLDEEQATTGFVFFPFQRSLFHEAEAVLDAIIWENLQVWAERKVEEEEEKHKQGSNSIYHQMALNFT